MRFEILLLFLILPACGKVAPPLPPQPAPHATIQDLAVDASGARNRLTFSVPARTEWVEVYRQCNPLTSGDRINLAVRLSPDELPPAETRGRFIWQDPKRDVTGCRYALRFVDTTGLRSEFSNFAP